MTRRPQVFLSHSSLDKQSARRIRDGLAARGIDSWLDEVAIKAGDSIPEKISEGIAQAEILCLLISHNSSSSRWVAREWNSFLHRSMAESVVILPCKLEDCAIPELLRDIKFADFSNDFDIGMAQIFEAIDARTDAIATKLIGQGRGVASAQHTAPPILGPIDPGLVEALVGWDRNIFDLMLHRQKSSLGMQEVLQESISILSEAISTILDCSCDAVSRMIDFPCSSHIKLLIAPFDEADHAAPDRIRVAFRDTGRRAVIRFTDNVFTRVGDDMLTEALFDSKSRWWGTDELSELLVRASSQAVPAGWRSQYNSILGFSLRVPRTERVIGALVFDTTNGVLNKPEVRKFGASMVPLLEEIIYRLERLRSELRKMIE